MGGAYFECLSSALAVLFKVGGAEVVEGAVKRVFGESLERFGSVVERARDISEKVCDKFVARVQVEVQRALGASRRKRLSAYYTVDVGRRFMAELYSRYFSGAPRVLADPFMGSGLTLTEAVARCGADAVKRVWGVEAEPLAALTGYAALTYFLGGDYERVEVYCGDSFEVIPDKGLDADAVLTNPPFVRWELLGKGLRERVRRFLSEKGYDGYLRRRQLNLSVAGFLLADSALRHGGLMVSVLPSSTFYTITGEAVRRVLLERYDVLALAEPPTDSFSMGSGFKENIVVALKGRRDSPTLLVRLGEGLDLGEVSGAVLRGDRVEGVLGARRLSELTPLEEANWLTLFMGERASELMRLTRSPLLTQGSEVLGGLMVRGVEMYGPDFFFLPNRFWSLVEVGDGLVMLRHRGGAELTVPRRYLVEALRRPSLYSRSLLAEPGHYLLSIPEEPLERLPRGLQRYIEWGVESGAAAPAIKAFGGLWYCHVGRQLRAKRPYGLLFLPDKVDWGLGLRSTFPNLVRRPVAASKNFYVVRGVGWGEACFLSLWFDSAAFLSLLLVAGRRISGRWTRFLEEDYMWLPAPRLGELGEDVGAEAARLVARLPDPMPPLAEQFWKPPRWRLMLDELVSETLGLGEPEEFYDLILSLLEEC